MKKLVTIAALLGAASVSFAQIVDFENFNNSLIYTNSVHNGPATGPISGSPGTYYFMLLSAETTTTTIDATLGGGRPLDQGGWSPETQGLLLGKNTSTPGLMNGNITTDPGTFLIGSGPGETANFAVVGWSANLGSDWFGVLAWWNDGNPNSGPSGWFGISDIAQDVIVGGGGYPDPTIFGPTVGYEVQGFTLNYYEVPEPSTFALAGLGAVVLLAFRRRMESVRP